MFGDLVDMPISYFFVESVSQRKFSATSCKVIQDYNYYFVIVLRLRKSSLRELMENTAIGLNNKRRVYLNVLEQLKPVVCGFAASVNYHGDLKEMCSSSVL